MINGSKYPIDDQSSQYNDLVKKCTKQLGSQGFVSLTNFLDPCSVQSLVSSILNLEQQGIGFYSTERHNVFLEDNVSEDKDKRHTQLESSKLLINAKDLAPHVSELENLFHSTSFLRFIRDVLKLELHPSTDEYGKYYVNIFHEGDGLNFHFDRSEFSISLILQPAADGGKFQFAPNSRDLVEDAKSLQSVLNALFSTESKAVHEPPLAAGDLYLFRGQNSLHRVTKVTKGTRINVILTYNTEPNAILNDYTLKKFFGVSRS